MPYIEQEKRDKYKMAIKHLGRQLPKEVPPGELNYVLSKFLDELMVNPSYSDYNALMGVLEAVKQELYRRRVSEYEDEKIEQNGDIY